MPEPPDLDGIGGLQATRRDVLIGSAAAASIVLAQPALSKTPDTSTPNNKGGVIMASIKVKDGTEIFYKEWGSGQPIVFHHGWPLSGDDWDAQMMFFSARGFRVIAHDRRGHGRSSPSSHSNDMDTYAADVDELSRHLGLRDAIHVGHSTGGGEVTRYVAKYGSKNHVAKAVLIAAIPPTMLRTPAYPGGLPIEVFDGIRSGVASNRADFYYTLAAGTFYGFNRPGAVVSQGVVENWFRQAIVGDIKAQFDCIKAFSETDFTEDLKKTDQPVLVMHGDDDQIVPIENSAKLAVKLLKNGRIKIYPGLPHGMITTHADLINRDILAFIQN